MFTTSLTVLGDSSSSRVYDLRSILNGTAIRGVAAAPANAPEILTISHSTSSRNGIPLDRHLLRLDLTKINSDNKPVMASVYCVIEVPQDTVITLAIIKDMRTQLKNLLDDTNTAKLVNSEP